MAKFSSTMTPDEIAYWEQYVDLPAQCAPIELRCPSCSALFVWSVRRQQYAVRQKKRGLPVGQPQCVACARRRDHTRRIDYAAVQVMRAEGRTFEEIGRRYGVTRQAAHFAWKKGAP